MPNQESVREKIAKVIGEELPWLEEHCLDFADKIIKVLTPKSEGQEDLDAQRKQRIMWQEEANRLSMENKELKAKLGQDKEYLAKEN